MYDLVPYCYYHDEAWLYFYFAHGLDKIDAYYACINKKQRPLYLRPIDVARKNHKALKFFLSGDWFPEIQDIKAFDVKTIHKQLLDVYEREYLQETLDMLQEATDVNAIKVYDNYFKNLHKKMNRVKTKLESYRSNCDDEHHLYFCTITLRKCFRFDKITSDVYDDIRKKLRKHIKEYSDFYLFNKDFGLRNTKRLHFHGVALFKDSELPSLRRSTKSKFAPICSFERIDDHSEFIARYINKLSYHALKVNYGKFRENLIYSRTLSI